MLYGMKSKQAVISYDDRRRSYNKLLEILLENMSHRIDLMKKEIERIRVLYNEEL